MKKTIYTILFVFYLFIPLEQTRVQSTLKVALQAQFLFPTEYKNRDNDGHF